MAGINAKLLFLAPLLVAFVPPIALEEEIRFSPEAGAAFTVSYTNEVTMTLEDQSMMMVFNGEEHEQETPDVDVELSQSFEAVFSDEVLSFEDGRVTKLRRTFNEVGQTRAQSAEGPDGSNSSDDSGSTELEGTSVVFTWDAEEESYTVAFWEDEDGDEDLLEELEYDIYFEGLLPESAVSVGDTWEAEIRALDLINDPSGDLQLDWENEADEDDDDDDVSQQYEDNLEGTIECKLNEVIAEDGVRIALIGITVEAGTSSEKSQDVDNEGVSGTIGEDIEITFEFEGVLRWDLGAGHATELELGGDITYTVTSSQDLSRDDETFQMDVVQSFAGTNTISCEISQGGSEE